MFLEYFVRINGDVYFLDSNEYESGKFKIHGVKSVPCEECNVDLVKTPCVLEKDVGYCICSMNYRVGNAVEYMERKNEDRI
jgi:hypothetical protein